MSNRTLVYSPLSRCDLDEIFDYISCELENPAAVQGRGRPCYIVH